HLVVVDVDEENSGEMCPAILKTATITITLMRPLGDRLVLDSGTGLPVVQGVKRFSARHRMGHRPPTSTERSPLRSGVRQSTT
ncbi:hypothetical protein, partial [Streptosporangium sp. H16]|uniref:hypothetical protein n=1 Tax=Streptosporangium sp. H16 TaxID=3444184 RepID=UPI003F79038A